MLDPTKLSEEERKFVAGIVNRLNSGDAKGVGTELLADFKRALTLAVLDYGFRLGDVLCQGEGAKAFNESLERENKTPLHLICAGYAMALKGREAMPHEHTHNHPNEGKQAQTTRQDK